MKNQKQVYIAICLSFQFLQEDYEFSDVLEFQVKHFNEEEEEFKK